MVPPTYVAVLSVSQGQGRRLDMTAYAFFLGVARLGGYDYYRKGRPPGWLVLWRGWGQLLGDPHSRDTAYHQGTVWPWLTGAYVDALLRYRGAAAAESVRLLIDNMRAHLADACLGTISEIFDGDAPHTPRGCVAQAWSVAEVLRCWAKTASINQ